MATQTNKFGELLRSLREKRRLSQTQLARKLGVTPQSVNQLENGARANPKLDTLRKLALALRVSLKTLTA